MQIEKMKSTAKFMNTGAKVVGGIFGAAAIVCAVFAVLVLTLGEGMYEMGTFSLDLDYMTLRLAQGFPVNMGMMKWFLCLGLLGVGVICLLVQRASCHLRAILAPVEAGRPFEPGTPVCLRKIAWLTLIGGAVTQMMGMVEFMILKQIYPMEALFSSAAVVGVEYTFTMDFNFVWIACLLLFLSYIFSYGQSLQQEADETL